MLIPILQVIALFAIAAVLWLRKPLPGPQGPRGEKGEKGDPGEAAPSRTGLRSDLAKRLRKHGAEWMHDGEVQIGSEAYLHALRTPGLGVQRPGEQIDPGVQ